VRRPAPSERETGWAFVAVPFQEVTATYGPAYRGAQAGTLKEEGPIAPKSKAGTRTVPLLAVLRPYLKNVAGSSELIFGRGPDQPFDPKTVGDRAKRSWNKANDREGGEGELRQTLRPMTLHEC
jgi:hypothetical protein